jgi:hypothetical protein
MLCGRGSLRIGSSPQPPSAKSLTPRLTPSKPPGEVGLLLEVWALRPAHRAR